MGRAAGKESPVTRTITLYDARPRKAKPRTWLKNLVGAAIALPGLCWLGMEWMKLLCELSGR